MSEYTVVGQTVARVDAVEKVTGAAQYGADVHPPGMLYGKLVRSKHAHANIRSIDTSEAEKIARSQGNYYPRRCAKWQTRFRNR